MLTHLPTGPADPTDPFERGPADPTDPFERGPADPTDPFERGLADPTAPFERGPADPTDPFESEPHSGLVWFAEECMNNGAPLERYIVHAESIGDRELATFFRRALAHGRRVPPGDRRRLNRRARGDRRRG